MHFEQVSAQDLGWYEVDAHQPLGQQSGTLYAALPHPASQGSIVAVSSLAGLIGVPGPAEAPAKFAMAIFFEALRIKKLKPAGVSVTTALPGVVDTRIRYHGYPQRQREARPQASAASGRRRDDGGRMRAPHTRRREGAASARW